PNASVGTGRAARRRGHRRRGGTRPADDRVERGEQPEDADADPDHAEGARLRRLSLSGGQIAPDVGRTRRLLRELERARAVDVVDLVGDGRLVEKADDEGVLADLAPLVGERGQSLPDRQEQDRERSRGENTEEGAHRNYASWLICSEAREARARPILTWSDR